MAKERLHFQAGIYIYTWGQISTSVGAESIVAGEINARREGNGAIKHFQLERLTRFGGSKSSSFY